MHRQPVFYLSDRTGITAEALGLSLLSQFESIAFEASILPFIDNPGKMDTAIQKITEVSERTGLQAIVFSTMVDDALRAMLQEAPCFLIDFFESFIGPLEKALKIPSSHSVGLLHNAKSMAYNTRINALNFTLNHDDGMSFQGYADADVIVLGVSRSGKTPTSLYLAMHYGLMAANYPLTPDDLDAKRLPDAIRGFEHKCVGLTIDPMTLHAIRQARKPNSHYASLKVCKDEITLVEHLLHQAHIPILSSTDRSIEELSAKILLMLGIERKALP